MEFARSYVGFVKSDVGFARSHIEFERSYIGLTNFNVQFPKMHLVPLKFLTGSCGSHMGSDESYIGSPRS